MLNLMSVDKAGVPYTSYSQLSKFKWNRSDYYDRYILRKPFEGNIYTEFGNKVGSALETGDFSSFSDNEQLVLSKCDRLDLFEHRVKLVYDDFYVIGYVDTLAKNFMELIDYKTGSEKTKSKYINPVYDQMQIYALALRQMYGVKDLSARVQFLHRSMDEDGNLLLEDKDPENIHIDVSYDKLRETYWGIKKTVNEMSDFNNDCLSKM